MIFLIAIVVIFVHMCLIWLWYRYTNNPSVVDVGWGSGLTIIGMLYIYSSPLSSRKLLLSLVLLIWGFRLGGYLWFTRIHRGFLDKRYTKLSENWKISKPLGFLLNFQLQGIFIFVVSLPWYFISQIPSDRYMRSIDYLMILIALLLIATQSLADYQLQSFKAVHKNQVCDVGLWFYARHPNYFFEWLIWCVYAYFALPASFGFLAWISPLMLFFIMTKITAPLTEKGSIQSKGVLYLNYQNVTPMFFPNLLKKNRH